VASKESEQTALFEKYLHRWNLVRDGRPIATQSSDLLPVLRNDGAPAVLKIAKCGEERLGNALMVWWNGEGAARVFAQEDDALLLERAIGDKSLTEMARSGRDSEASQIICAVAEELHTVRARTVPNLISLTAWFGELRSAAGQYGGILAQSLQVSQELLNQPQDIVVLHGDIHHGNILDFGSRGWLAIDPKGLLGERGFDFANIFCNPDLKTAASPGRLALQATVISQAARLERRRLLKWILAYAGLSAAWSLSTESENPQTALAVAHLAAGELASFK
jgi:streptomycin 6-kinase